jgi:hypothetical protein
MKVLKGGYKIVIMVSLTRVRSAFSIGKTALVSRLYGCNEQSDVLIASIACLTRTKLLSSLYHFHAVEKFSMGNGKA